MAQIFTASADTRLRAALIIAIGILVLITTAGYATEGFSNIVGWVHDQPVPFSHQHHVAGLGIDCRYCHTSVETGARAGLPATHICMSCHSQIWTNAAMLAPVRKSLADNTPLVWHRVNRVPDYVYFNHSIHVTKGVPCVTCHGRVDRMPLLAAGHPFHMRFCLDCHRNPEPSLRPPEEVTRMDWTGWVPFPKADPARPAHPPIDTAKITQCNTCHR